MVPILTIADGIPNSGSYVWAVPSDLQPDTSYYGIELIVEGTGEYQYSPQCGVSNPALANNTAAVSTVTVVPATNTAASFPTATFNANATAYESSSPSATDYSYPSAYPSAYPSSVVEAATSVFSLTAGPATATHNAAVANVAQNMALVAGLLGAVVAL